MIHVFVGIQGSGKSTFSKKLSSEIGAKIISTDGIRMANPGIEERLVWDTVYKELAEALKNGEEAIFDATSINIKTRKRFFENVSNYGVEVIAGAYYFDTNLDECMKRVEIRNQDENEHHLPVEVVPTYLERLEIPTLEEGFKFVKTVRLNEVVETIE